MEPSSFEPWEGHGDSGDTAPPPLCSPGRQRVHGVLFLWWWQQLLSPLCRAVPMASKHPHGPVTPCAAHTHNSFPPALISGIKLFINFSFALTADQLGSAATHRDIFHTYPSSWWKPWASYFLHSYGGQASALPGNVSALVLSNTNYLL